MNIHSTANLIGIAVTASADLALLRLDQFAYINISLCTPHPFVQEHKPSLGINNPVPAQPQPISFKKESP